MRARDWTSEKICGGYFSSGTTKEPARRMTEGKTVSRVELILCQRAAVLSCEGEKGGVSTGWFLILFAAGGSPFNKDA